MDNKRGIVLFIIGIIVLVTIAGCNSSPPPQQYANGSGNSNPQVQSGVDTSQESRSSGSSSGSGSTDGISSWCTQSRLGPGVGTVIGIETYRGVQTCHTQLVVGPTTQDWYFISHSTASDDLWIKNTMISPKGSFTTEEHHIGARCTEYSCSIYSGDAKKTCELLSSSRCTTEVD